MAAARSTTWSLAKMLEMWLATVLRAMPSRAPGDAGAEDRLARVDGADGARDVVLARALEQVTACAGAHRGEHRVVVGGVHGEHQDRGVRQRAAVRIAARGR